MTNRMDLKGFLITLKKRIPLIALVTVLAVILSGVVSYTMMKPTYEASTQLLVNHVTKDEDNVSTLDIDSNIQLISTYNIIIKSPAILSQVIDRLELSETPETLTEKIDITSVEDSQVLTINVQDESMSQAVQIANTTAAVFQNDITNLMQIDNVSILARAEVPAVPVPVKPDPLFNMAIAAIFGFLLGTGLTLLLEQLNTTVRTEEDAEELLGVPVLGIVVPYEDEKQTKRTPVRLIGKEEEANGKNEAKQPSAAPKIGRLF